MLHSFHHLLVAASAAFAPQEAYAHPADSAFYVRIPDVQALIAAYPMSAGAQLLADPELHQAVGKVMGRDEPVAPLDLLLAEYAKRTDAGQMPPILEIASGLHAVSVSVAVPNGDLYGHIQRIEELFERGEYEAAGRARGDLKLRIIADFVDIESCAEAASALEPFIEKNTPQGHELRTGELDLGEPENAFGGQVVRTWHAAPKDGEKTELSSSGAVMIAGARRVVIANGSVDVNGLGRLLSQVDDSTSWPHSSRFSSIGKPLGTTLVELSFNSPVQELVADNNPLLLPLLDVAEGLFGTAASAVIHGGEWRLSLDGASGQFVTQGIYERSKVGPLSGLLGAGPIGSDALTLAHPEAMVATVTSLDKDVLVRLVSDVIREEKAKDPEDYEKDGKGILEPAMDLAKSLGGSAAYSLAEIKSLVTAPNLMLSVELSDPEGFKGGMDELFRSISEQGGGLEVGRREYKKISTLYEFSIAGLFGDSFSLPGLPIDLRTLIRPTVGILNDGRAVLTMTGGYAKKEVRRVRALQKEGADSAAVHPGLASFSGQDSATTLTHADWARLVAGTYDMGKALLPMLAGQMDLPVDVAQLPSSDLIVRHYEPTRASARIEGSTVRYEVRSSFGLEGYVVPLAGIAGGTSFVAASRTLAAEEPVIEVFPSGTARPVDRSEVTRSTLTDLHVALTLYQLDNNGSYPLNLADLALPSDAYKNGYLPAGGAVPSDGWQHPFVYSRSEDGFSLHSVGPNGIDDGGLGDDVKEPIE